MYLQVKPADVTPQGLASNPGSGTNKTPANPAETPGGAVQSRAILREQGHKGRTRPVTGRYEDRLAPVGRSSNG
jgi:hypothetical protein